MSRDELALKSGLQFNVSNIKKIGNIDNDILAIQVASTVEYIVAEIFELSGNYTRDKRKVRIKKEFIIGAIKNDSELSILFPNHNLNYNNKFEKWSRTVLNQVHPGMQINKEALEFIDILIDHLINIMSNYKGTFDETVLLLFPHELAKYCIREAQKSVIKYLSK